MMYHQHVDKPVFNIVSRINHFFPMNKLLQTKSNTSVNYLL